MGWLEKRYRVVHQNGDALLHLPTYNESHSALSIHVYMIELLQPEYRVAARQSPGLITHLTQNIHHHR